MCFFISSDLLNSYDTTDKFLDFDESKDGFVVFDDMLHYKLKTTDLFNKWATYRFISILFMSKLFRCTTKTIQNQQTLKDVENTCTKIAGFDVNYDKLKEVCREAWNVEDYFRV